jgi:hypothetical protein
VIDATAGEWYKSRDRNEKGEAVSALRPTGGIVAALLLLTASASISARPGGGAPAAQSGKPGGAVESRSAALASELTMLLSSQKLDSIATPDADTYVGALYIPGTQLLVVRAKLADKNRMGWLLDNKMYKEAYLDLNSASEPASRILVSDLGGDGLHFKAAKDQPFDMVNLAGRSMSFDGKWGGKELPSREEYAKSFETSDEQYSQMLQVLISAIKKSS